MKEVIEKLKQAERDYLRKSLVIGSAIRLLLDEDSDFDVTQAMLEDHEDPDHDNTPIEPYFKEFSARTSPSLEHGTLRKEILTVIEEDGPIGANDIAEMLMSKFPERYVERVFPSVRSSVSGTLTFLRARKPKIKNLKWDTEQKAYSYWFEGKR